MDGWMNGWMDFFNCSWVGNRWQQYITHLHTDIYPIKAAVFEKKKKKY